jgi:hypothetical protein
MPGVPQVNTSGVGQIQTSVNVQNLSNVTATSMGNPNIPVNMQGYQQLLPFQLLAIPQTQPSSGVNPNQPRFQLIPTQHSQQLFKNQLPPGAVLLQNPHGQPILAPAPTSSFQPLKIPNVPQPAHTMTSSVSSPAAFSPPMVTITAQNAPQSATTVSAPPKLIPRVPCLNIPKVPLHNQTSAQQNIQAKPQPVAVQPPAPSAVGPIPLLKPVSPNPPQLTPSHQIPKAVKKEQDVKPSIRSDTPMNLKTVPKVEPEDRKPILLGMETIQKNIKQEAMDTDDQPQIKEEPSTPVEGRY